MSDVQVHGRGHWLRLLKKLNIRPSKGMGQNFLVDDGVARRIAHVADLSPTDTVIEIGPGLGILTRHLAARASRVIAFELDKDLARYLTEHYRNRPAFEIREADARFIDLGELPSPVKVVANLPYGVATVIIRNLLEQEPRPVSLSVMVQREVAERIVAQPPEMSLLTLAVQLYADARLEFIVPPDVFVPPPAVHSAVITITPYETAALDAETRSYLFQLATHAFAGKRKTIANSLANGLQLTKSDVERALDHVWIDPMRRPQTLSVDEWIRIAESGVLRAAQST